MITVKAGALLKCPTCLCALRQLPLSSCPRGTTGNPTRRNRCHICRQHNHGLHQCLLRPVLMSFLCEHFRKITAPLSFSFSMTIANESCHSYKRTMSYPVKVCFCQYVQSQLSNITFAHAKNVYLEGTVMRTSQFLCLCIFLVRKMDNQHCLKCVLKKSSMS